MPRAAITAVVVNWNHARATARCVDSLLADDEAVDVIVVDNGSEEPLEPAVSGSERVTVMRLAENRGYAGGCNAGVARAIAEGARYAWMLNNDTVVRPDAASHMRWESERHGDNVIVSPLIVTMADPSIAWYAGGTIDRRSMRTRHVLQGEPAARARTGRVDWGTGCSLFAHASVFERVGPMDERYFLYLEDVDWCLRAGARGVATRFVREAIIEHEASLSVDRLPSGHATYYGWRNRYLLAANHAGLLARAAIAGGLYWRIAKAAARIAASPGSRSDARYRGQVRGLLDAALRRWGKAPASLDEHRPSEMRETTVEATP